MLKKQIFIYPLLLISCKTYCMESATEFTSWAKSAFPCVHNPINLKTLIKSPIKYLDHIYFINGEKYLGNTFFGVKTINGKPSKIAKDILNIEHCFAPIKESTRICPISFLDECREGEGNPCPLDRSKNPEYRTTFEDTVSSALYTQLKEQGTTTYVSFGGYLFQDFICIVKALHMFSEEDFPTKERTLSIFAIDPLYDAHEILFKNSYPSVFRTTNRTDLFVALKLVACFTQFSETIRRLFPNISIKFDSYSNYKTFLESHVLKNSNKNASLVVASDLGGGLDEFTVIATELSKKNKDTKSISLGHCLNGVLLSTTTTTPSDDTYCIKDVSGFSIYAKDAFIEKTE